MLVLILKRALSMNNDIYLVWIGGLIDYEGNNLAMAQATYKTWLSLGYDDVKLETIKGA
jgi:hypothetical protein